MKSYEPNIFFKNKHINTCYPTLFRKISVEFERERVESEDGDFFDIDWIKNNNEKILVLCHGLEGSSKSKYIQATAKYFSNRGWDIVALNYRGCSGEINRKITFYNMGDIRDLKLVVSRLKDYKKVVLAGFSLGGGLVLNYLGRIEEYPKNLYSAVVVSAPCDSYGSAREFEKKENTIYRKHFLKALKNKVKAKEELYKKEFDFSKALNSNSIVEFDEYFTAPLYGYKDAKDYYDNVSPNQYIEKVKIPTFILMAKDDPIMSESCYPIEESKKNKNITLEITEYGGHVGYASFDEFYWLEKRIYRYIEELKNMVGEKL